MVTEYKTVRVPYKELVPVPEYLTQPVPLIDRPQVVDTVALGATLKACIIRLEVANGQLAEIAALDD